MVTRVSTHGQLWLGVGVLVKADLVLSALECGSARQLAAADLDLLDRYESPDEQLEAAVALTVLYEPVLLSLRRIAQAEESDLRYGPDDAERDGAGRA
ncbi:hypothetical protein SALBM135S_04541 [Streptomyces alboniger]